VILRVATRASRLSLIQVEEAMEWARRAIPGLRYEPVKVSTLGDKVRDKPIHAIGRIGVFEKEVDRAVLEGLADVAVHSMKDLPSRLPEGLEIVMVPPRGDIRDSIVPPPKGDMRGARVGTSSIRREALTRLYYPEARVETLRGNLDTRLRKLREGLYDHIIVAEVGLRRLGALDERLPLDPLKWPPAPGQGLIAVVAPSGSRVAEILRKATHKPSHAMAEAERGLLSTLGVGCRVPVGGFSYIKGETIVVMGAHIDPDRGIRWVRAKGDVERAREVGEEAGYMLSRLLEGSEH
jgi:hydroxymethylbilane synthase